MTNNKIDNLITFTLMFHHWVGINNDSYLLNCDIEYIWSKYQSMIGFEPGDSSIFNHNEREDYWQNVTIDDYKSIAIKAKWMDKWNSRKILLDKNKERVLNYLCVMDTIIPTPSNIFSTFESYIGSIEKVKDEKYQHIHELLKRAILEYREKFRRELNLEILV